MTTTTIAAWLLTYLVHSTIILTAVLVFSRVLDGRGLALQESLLRMALLGGVVTASLQLGLGIAPIAGKFSFEPAIQPVVSAAINLEPSSLHPGTGNGLLASDSPRNAAVWATPFVVFWGIASALALLAILRSILDLRRLLSTRCFQPAGRLVESLAIAIGLRQRVRISTSKAIAMPFATGFRRPEICCPERVNDLAIEHKRGLFAHELAHLARRDPAWQLVYRIGGALFVLQPLNRLVRRRLEELAEHLTDERAAAGTGDRLGLARCLVVVAHWGHSGDLGLPATALAAGPRLDRRVRRLISGTTERQFSSRWTTAVSIAVLIGSVSILPAIGTNPAHAELSVRAANSRTVWSISSGETNAGSKVTGTTTWSTVADRPNDMPPVAEPLTDAPSAEKPPTPPSRAPAPPAPEKLPSKPAPKAAPAPASPPAAPAPEPSSARPAPQAPSPAQAPPVSPVPPAPAVEPAPQSAPAPVVPSSRERTTETERRREEARQRSSERTRAEAIARQQREVARVQAEHAREIATETANRRRRTEIEVERMRRRARGVQGEAERLAREAAVAERDRARALRDEARVRARQSTLRVEQLTAEQREAMLQKALEMRERAEIRNNEAQITAEERARQLAEEARALAERAEAERRERENEKR